MTMPFDDTHAAPTEALLVLYANGDREASRVLTRRLLPLVLSHAERLLGNRAEAEEIAQEAMLRLWKIAPDWRHGEAKVTTWLYRVVGNLCTDLLRRRRGVGLDEVPEPVSEQASPADRMQEVARASALQSALARLPKRQAQAVILRHIEELSNPEIAEIMDISVEAVESLIARGKRALSADLTGQREELGISE
ncbi:MAG: RNA polymerase sigma factor [Pseudomonadota bacterium]